MQKGTKRENPENWFICMKRLFFEYKIKKKPKLLKSNEIRTIFCNEFIMLQIL